MFSGSGAPRPRHRAAPRRRLVLSFTLLAAVSLAAFAFSRILLSQPQSSLHTDEPNHRTALQLDGTAAHSSEAAKAAAVPQQALASKAGDDERIFNTAEHSEYQGESLQWGPHNLQASAAACAASCIAHPKCNIWVYCGVEAGCGGATDLGAHKACWLKQQPGLDPAKPDGATKRADVLWTSGVVYTARQLREANAVRGELQRLEKERIQALRDNLALPMVFFDVEIKGKKQSRIEFVLFTHTSPLAAENFRALCTGERGVVPADNVPKREGRGLAYHFKGNFFYRIIDRFIDQAGSNTDAVYGGQFKDEAGALGLKHDRPGLLSLANSGPNTNGGHFSIVVAPAPHLNTHYGIFGEVVSGWDTMYAINAVSTGKRDNTAGREEGCKITESGQLRYGTASAALQAQYPATAAALVKKPHELFVAAAA